jgi:hypothetical protein
VVVVCVVVAAAALVVGGGGAAAEGPPALSTPSQFASSTFDVEVFANGTADWTFVYFTEQFQNQTEREQFSDYADRFESRNLSLWTNFVDRATVLTDLGRNATGRDMGASDFTRSATVRQTDQRGEVRMSFRWSNFGRADGQRVVVADVFEGVFYIGPDQWLVFDAGPEVRFDAGGVEPTPDEFSGDTLAASDTVTWFGERQFSDNHSRVTFTTAPLDGDGGDTTDSGPGAGQSGSGGDLPIGLLALGLVLGLGAAVAWRAGVFDSLGDGGGPDGAGASGPPTDSGGAAGNQQSGTDSTDAGSAAITDEELLSDEDQVIQLLENNGGRMKQVNIVEETGWSKSKVSMLLSEMADEDAISKLRVGRENIISLSGHEPDAAGSPFDDE